MVAGHAVDGGGQAVEDAAEALVRPGLTQVRQVAGGDDQVRVGDLGIRVAEHGGEPPVGVVLHEPAHAGAVGEVQIGYLDDADGVRNLAHAPLRSII